MLTKLFIIVLVCTGLVHADSIDWPLLQRFAEAARKQSSTSDGRGSQTSGSPFSQNSGLRNGAGNSEDRLLNRWESSDNSELRDLIERYYRNGGFNRQGDMRGSGFNSQRDIRGRSVGSLNSGRDQAQRDWLGDYGGRDENRQDSNIRDWWDGFGRTNERSRDSQQNDWWGSMGRVLPSENRYEEQRDWRRRDTRIDHEAEFKNFLDQIIGMMGMESEVKKLNIPKSLFMFK